MMAEEKVVVPFAAETLSLATDANDGRARLPSTDVPIGCRVSRSATDLVLEILYRHTTHEQRIQHESGPIAYEVGKYSALLFSVRVDTTHSAADVSNIAAALRNVLNGLKSQEERSGPRLNYWVATHGLDLEPGSVQTPSWLVDAMKAQGIGPHSSG